MGWDIERLKIIFDVLNKGYILVSTEGVILEGSKLASEILNYKSKELAGNLFPPESWFVDCNDISDSESISNLLLQTFNSRNPVRSISCRKLIEDTQQETWINMSIIPPDENDSDKNPALLIILEDVSDNIKTDKWLFQISKALDQNPVSIILTDNKEHIFYANPEFLRLTGLMKQEIIGRHFRYVCSLNSKKYQAIQKKMQTKQTWQGIIENKNKNNEIYWSQTTIAPLLDKNNEIVSFIITKVDISELKQIQDKLENERILLRTVIDNLPDAIFAKNKDLKKTLTNKADLLNIGLEEKDVVGKTDYDIFPEYIARKLIVDDLQVIMNNKPILNKQEKIVDVNGNEKILSTSKVPLKNKDGETIGLIGIGHDITLGKEKENELIINQYGIDNANIAILRINENGKILYCNNHASKILGYTKDDLIQKTIFDIDSNFSKKGWVFQSSNPDERHSSILISEHKRKNNSTFPVELTISYFIYENKFYSYVFISDITERELVKSELKKKNEVFASMNEDFLKQNKELSKSLEYITQINTELEVALKRAEESDKLKSSFLANLSHEIRTPMNGILGFIELLKQQLLTDNPNLGYMDIIQNSGKRLVNVISEIIDISKIHAGQIKVNNSKTNLLRLIGKICQTFGPEAEHKGIDLQFNQTKESIIIVTDEEKLEAAFSKILNNAIKFTQEGYIEVSYRKSKNHVSVCFKDTGIGIEPGMDDKIFEIFRQGDYELSRRFEGTGIGLSIAKAYIELLGGTLNYKSKINVGTTFIVKIPIQPDYENANTDKPTKNQKDYSDLAGKKILVIDQETELMNYLQMTFNSYHAEFIIIKDYVEAMNYMEKVKGVDLILINLNAESSERIQTIKDLRKSYSKQRLVAMIKTGSVLIKKAALSAGCDTIIPEDETRGAIVDMIVHAF